MGFRKICAAALASGMMLSFVPATVMADTTGWRKDNYGWKYVDDSGYVKGDWKNVDGKWYYFHESGYMVCNVSNYYIDGIYYAFDSSGACLNPSEALKKQYGFHDADFITGISPAGEPVYETGTFYHDPDGQLALGWRRIDGKWYYFDYENAYMATSIYSCYYPYYIDDEYYYFDNNGEMITGWYDCGSFWVFADNSGVLYVEKWLCDSGKWYYFNIRGEMLADVKSYSIEGIEYDFDENGVCLNPYATSNQHTEGWVYKDAHGYYSKTWFYYDEDGSLHKGWLYTGGKWYYMDPEDGSMHTGNLYLNGKTYYFDYRSGAMITGWRNVSLDHWMYAGPDGDVYHNKWLFEDGKWYYFDFTGNLVINSENYTICGIDYTFDSDGVCVNPDATEKMITGWYKRTVRGFAYWYYYSDEGDMCYFRWIFDAGNWYYIGGDGIMVHSASDYYVGGLSYDFDDNGVCLNPYDGRELPSAPLG